MSTNRRVEVVVGEVWSGDELTVEVENVRRKGENQSEAGGEDTKAKIAGRLVLGAGVLVAGIAAYAMAQSNAALLDRIFNLVEWTILFALGWVTGHGEYARKDADEKR